MAGVHKLTFHRREDVAIAVRLTILGLLADLAYIILVEAAPRFLLSGMWAEAAVYAALGTSAVAVIVGRVLAELAAQDEIE